MSARPNILPHRLCVAPMMDWTDRHCRRLHRGLSARALLYTEMLTAPALIHGGRERLLGFDPADSPVALQLGGSDPAQLAEAARIGEGFGYDEINLNVGCPSDRVQTGRFGACLMREPDLVAHCMAAIGAAVRIPATVKCRIGVDDQDPDESLFGLVDACAGAGVKTFVVHARKAWLEGLSPKENRDVPPLDYPLIWRLKAERPQLTIIVNGGISNLDEAEAHLAHVDGVMLGRVAYHDPGILGAVDRRLFGEAGADVNAQAAVDRYRPHVIAELARGTPLATMIRPMLGLFAGQPGARAWRRLLTVGAARAGAGWAVVEEALGAIAQAAVSRLEPA
ncbi:MAG TPA: tRNA dihydrouridine(20/20a) synthase DusA [Caulobacteraceae bacterium]|nr:tRNA dihydrouridine(20/20a) synthase DusA [Caulobacteraceae bacterium]